MRKLRLFAATSTATICTAAVGCGVSIVATPIGGAAAGAGVGVAASGALTKLGTRLAKKYPCLKEQAKAQAALDALKAEMRQEMADQIATLQAAQVNIGVAQEEADCEGGKDCE